jgi:hypothetical protein
MRQLAYTVAMLALLAGVPAAACAGVLGAYAPALVARGNGIVAIDGTGAADITVTGFLIVSGETGLALPAGTDAPVEMSDGRLLYAQIQGTVRLSGRIDATCGGAGITLVARCDGAVQLTGYGYYIKGFKAGVWDAGGVTLRHAP